MEIYSPGLVTAQRELLYLLKSDPENSQLISGAKQRLYLLGISESQVVQLLASQKESYSFPVFSPFDGYVVEESALGNASIESAQLEVATEMGNGMNGRAKEVTTSSQNPIASTEIRIREGMYVSAGETIFKIINTSQVWAEFDLYQKEATNIKVNDQLEISFDNTSNEIVKSKINFIQPFFKAGEKFVELRVYLSNAKEK